MGNFKEDILLRATLGEVLYEEVKKYIAAWRHEYNEKHLPVKDKSWNDFINDKVIEHKKMIDWNVYEGDKKVGTTKALSSEDAVKKFAPFFSAQALRAVRSSVMKT